MGKRHECRYWKTFTTRRPFRYCSFCGRRQFRDDGIWRDEIKLKQFAEKWLPAISGTDPKTMMVVEVAYPFEWNTYENWNSVFRIRFDFGDVLARDANGLGSVVDVMNGWQSKWHEDLNLVDLEAGKFFAEKAGRPYAIGDNAYDAMRRFIQA